jgi:hypothetical protein
MIWSTRTVRFVRQPDRSRAITTQAEKPRPPERVPRISRLMALAIHFDRMLREGKVRDQSELARLVHVTQPRMTQIMNLNHLAPEIQEELLYLTGHNAYGKMLHEHALRAIAAQPTWRAQRMMWARIARRRLRPTQQ